MIALRKEEILLRYDKMLLRYIRILSRNNILFTAESSRNDIFISENYRDISLYLKYFQYFLVSQSYSEVVFR